MKRFFIVSLLSLFLVPVWASEVALVYQDETAVSQSKPWIGIVTSDGILITADQALGSKMTPLVGDMAGNLNKSALVRLDNDANVALIRKEGAITDTTLLRTHEKTAARFQLFTGPIPARKSRPPAPAVNPTPDTPVASVGQEGAAFLIKVNDQVVGEDPLILPVRRKRSECTLEVVNISTTAVWRVDVRLKSNPPISFWKRGKKKGLNDVPRRVFKYSYQAMFKKLNANASFKIPIEIFYIKEKSYEWTVSLKSKGELVVKTFPVQFESTK